MSLREEAEMNDDERRAEAKANEMRDRINAVSPKKPNPWTDPFEAVCLDCGLTKPCTLEPIGPTTGQTCLDCQKIPPAFRGRSLKKV